MLVEAFHLRMVCVRGSFTAQYALGQQRLTPESSDAFRIEVLRMQGPKPHG